MELIAYELTPDLGQRLVPAPRSRAWMEEESRRFARRCLPMMIANQAGWHIVLDEAVEARWSGGPEQDALEVVEGRGLSIFGGGILTFHVGWLFRTPPGWNLLVRGPANLPRDGVAPLEGVVETDWATQTFTMNWQLTRPGTVRFAAGDAIALLVPQRRGELEDVAPRIASIAEDPAALEGVRRFTESRTEFHAADRPTGWEGDYHRGREVGGDEPFPDHQRKLALRPFADERPDAG